MTQEPVSPKPAEAVNTVPSSDPQTAVLSQPTITESPPQTSPSPTATPPPNQRSGPLDPRVAELLSMFPDFDESVMASVLESVNGNQNQAVEILLGMSDPDYTPPVQEQRAPPSQTELDEQFARQLMLQDQEDQARRMQHDQRQAQRPPPQQPPQEAPYGSSVPGQPQQNQGQDTMAEIQQQLSKGIEVGKKTFNSFLSKAKQKLSEFEQQRQQQSDAQAQTSTSQPWGQNPADYSRTNYQVPPEAPQAAYYDPNPVSTPTQPSSNNRPSIDGGKIGVLPKRPVSLIQETPSPAANKANSEDDIPITLTDKTTASTTTSAPPKNANIQRRSTDGSDLEYEENPFEDDRR